MSYFLHLLVFFEIYVLVAASLNLLIGYAGLLQVAHAAYFGVGAYTTAILVTRFGWPFLPALLAAGIMAGVMSLLVSLPSWRFKGDPFVMTGLAVQACLFALMYNCVSVTGGPFGISGIPKPDIIGIKFATTGSISVLYSFITGGMILLITLLKMSPFGCALQAMRDDWLAARSLGISTRILKMEAFGISAAMVGVAGGMYACYITYIDPSSFSLDESILLVSMVIVGGTGNVRGPFVGALALIAIPEILRFMNFPTTMAANLRMLAYGLLLVIMMRWRPQGIAGAYRFE